MKYLIVIAVLFVAKTLTAQTNYNDGMQNALELLQDHKWNEAEPIFEQLTVSDPNEWLPNYYMAQINSLKTWSEKDPEKVSTQLQKAQNYIDKAMAIEKDNADILAMQALILINWVAFDGMTYGMEYSSQISDLYDKAYNLEPTNPMVVLGRAEWHMGSARFFGQDTKPFCKDIEKAIKLFANFKPKSPFHPNWGKERAHQMANSCKE